MKIFNANEINFNKSFLKETKDLLSPLQKNEAIILELPENLTLQEHKDKIIKMRNCVHILSSSDRYFVPKRVFVVKRSQETYFIVRMD